MRDNAVIHFRRNTLDLAGRKTNLRAHDVLDATIESLGPPKFSRQAFGDASVDGSSPLLHRMAAVVHSVPPKQHEHLSPSEKVSQGLTEGQKMELPVGIPTLQRAD